VKFNIGTAKGEATCIRIRIYSRAYMRWLRTGQNRTERNRMKRNSGERSVEARADCSRGAACLLAHLPVLNLYVVSATGSAIPLSHWRASPCRERKRERERGRIRGTDFERDEKERTGGGWQSERGAGYGRDISSRENCGREIESRVGQTNDRGASTALRTQKPRF